MFDAVGHMYIIYIHKPSEVNHIIGVHVTFLALCYPIPIYIVAVEIVTRPHQYLLLPFKVTFNNINIFNAPQYNKRSYCNMSHGKKWRETFL